MPKVSVDAKLLLQGKSLTGFYFDYTFSRDEYNLLREKLRREVPLEEVVELKEFLESISITKENLKEFGLNRIKSEYQKQCLISPVDSDCYPAAEEEQVAKGFSEWMEKNISYSVEITDLVPTPHEFVIHYKDGSTQRFVYNLFEKEIDLIRKLENEGKDLASLANKKRFGYLYEGIVSEAKEIIKKQNGINDNEIESDELLFTVNYRAEKIEYYGGKKYFTLAGIKDHFKQFLMYWYCYDEIDADIVVSDFPSFHLPYLQSEFLSNETIGDVEFNKFIIWTDFSMMLTMGNGPRFSFYWYEIGDTNEAGGPTEDLFDTEVDEEELAYVEENQFNK